MNDGELRQAMAALDLYRSQLEGLESNLQLVQASLEELARAKETLARYKDAPEGSEILVPIGGSSFIFAKVGSKDKAIVGIGTSTSVERPIDDAVQIMEERSKELIDTVKKLMERRAVLEQQASSLSLALEEEMRAMQG